jgi:hypothetical protein
MVSRCGLGRKTREWSIAQRRAIAVRDGGHCRFPGCHHSHYDIHHILPSEHGGLTDIDNGCCQCPRHHHMLHSGYHIQGHPNHQLRFYRPDGTHLGSTHPATTPATRRRHPFVIVPAPGAVDDPQASEVLSVASKE